MANANVALKSKHVALEEDICHQAVGLSQSEVPVGIGENSRRVLTAVLENGQPVIQQLIHMCSLMANNAKDATHGFASYQPIQGCFLSLR